MAITANFISDVDIGNANLLVSFTDMSVGSPISWDWDFGDGSVHSTEQNPYHVYTIAGYHTVSLSVTDGVTPSTETKSNYITVNMVSDFTVHNNVGPADLIVNFFDDSLGQPTEWAWDFGDGGTSTDQNPTHTYTSPGHYTVTLTSSRGTSESSNTITKTDFITVYTNADFMATHRTGYNSLSVQFVDKSTGNPTSWSWDFGDGELSSEQNPVHLYSYPGVYTIRLMVSSSFNSDQEVKVGYIVVSGTSTPDIAPKPDMLLYLGANTEVFKNSVGLRMVFVNKSQIG